mgnify:CR=1 FL=1
MNRATPRRYKLVGNELRYQLIINITEKEMSIKDAAKKTGINYENAKAIYRTYKLEGRQVKKASKCIVCNSNVCLCGFTH